MVRSAVLDKLPNWLLTAFQSLLVFYPLFGLGLWGALGWMVLLAIALQTTIFVCLQNRCHPSSQVLVHASWTMMPLLGSQWHDEGSQNMSGPNTKVEANVKASFYVRGPNKAKDYHPVYMRSSGLRLQMSIVE